VCEPRYKNAVHYGDLAGDTELITIQNQKLYQLPDSDLFQQTGTWRWIA